MLFRWLLGDSDDKGAKSASDELLALVRRCVPDADAGTVGIIGAVAGLLATVAHADRVYTAEERSHVRDTLARLHGFAPAALDAILVLLEQRLGDLAHESLQTYTRVLYEQTARDARVELLDVLMDLAAADDVLDMNETTLLRRIGRGLGMSDEEYLACQSRHRQRLSVLNAK